MAASSRFATVSEDDFRVEMFFSRLKYSPRLRLGEYSPIITEPEANNC